MKGGDTVYASVISAIERDYPLADLLSKDGTAASPDILDSLRSKLELTAVEDDLGGFQLHFVDLTRAREKTLPIDGRFRHTWRKRLSSALGCLAEKYRERAIRSMRTAAVLDSLSRMAEGKGL